MARLNRLVVATDLSAPARHAAERAALVARETGAAVELLHVASLAPLEKFRRLVAGVPAELEQTVIETARNEVRELAQALARRHQVSAGVHVTSGPLVRELAAQADAMSADLIVLGARGASFVRHLVLGSTAERMLGKSVRPMLVVKQAAHERYRSVLVPVDFSASSLPALRIALAAAPGAEITLLHVFDVPFEPRLRMASVSEETINRYRVAARQDAQHKLQALCDQAGVPPGGVAQRVLMGHPTRHIVEQEQERDCDLIVMGKHGESALEDLMLGSITKEVLARSQCDVLVSM